MRLRISRILGSGLAVILAACHPFVSPSIINGSEVEQSLTYRDPGFRQDITVIELADDGAHLIVGSKNGIASYLLASREYEWERAYIGIQDVSYFDNNERLLVLGSTVEYDVAVVMDALSGSIEYGIDLSSSFGATSVAISPDGDLAAFGFWGGVVMLWDLEQQKLLHLWTDHFERRQAGGQDTIVQWSPDGSQLVAGGWWTEIVVWDAITYDLVYLLDNPFEVSNIRVSPSGEYVAANSTENQIAIWDLTTGQLVSQWRMPELEVDVAVGGPTLGIEWSPDNQYLAAGTNLGAINIWETDQYSQIVSLKPEYYPAESTGVNNIRWAPDGELLYASTYDAKVLVWDWRNAQLLDSIGAPHFR